MTKKDQPRFFNFLETLKLQLILEPIQQFHIRKISLSIFHPVLVVSSESGK